MYINTLNIRELLLKSSDFFKSRAISPYYNSYTPTYPTVLTIVHLNSTFILSLYNKKMKLKKKNKLV
jgi:hypothetical protein